MSNAVISNLQHEKQVLEKCVRVLEKKVKDYIEQLETISEEFRQYKEMYESDDALAELKQLGLRRSWACVVMALLKSKMVNNTKLFEIIRSETNSDCVKTYETDPKKLIQVYICQIRSVLNRYGIEVQTHWAEGYSLAQKDKLKLLTLLKTKVNDDCLTNNEILSFAMGNVDTLTTFDVAMELGVPVNDVINADADRMRNLCHLAIIHRGQNCKLQLA